MAVAKAGSVYQRHGESQTLAETILELADRAYPSERLRHGPCLPRSWAGSAGGADRGRVGDVLVMDPGWVIGSALEPTPGVVRFT